MGGSNSPKHLQPQHWCIPDTHAEDASTKAYRSSAFSLIASRILVKRDELEKLSPPKRIICEDSPIHRTKMNIIAKNPAIYETFRDGLKENFYTHWGVSYSLQHFLDNRLLIPELKEDIVNHPLNRSRGSRGLFAYLGTAVHGSPQGSRRRRQSPCSVSSPLEKTTKESMVQYVDNLCLPSLDKIEQSSDEDEYDDDQSDGIVSVDDNYFVAEMFPENDIVHFSSRLHI